MGKASRCGDGGGGRVTARRRADVAVYSKSVVQQESGGAAAVGHGQVEPTHVVDAVVVRPRTCRRPVLVRDEPFLTCAGDVHRVLAVEHRLRRAAVPRRPVYTRRNNVASLEKLEFHDTDTDVLADIPARIFAGMSARRASRRGSSPGCRCRRRGIPPKAAAVRRVRRKEARRMLRLRNMRAGGCRRSAKLHTFSRTPPVFLGRIRDHDYYDFGVDI